MFQAVPQSRTPIPKRAFWCPPWCKSYAKSQIVYEVVCCGDEKWGSESPFFQTTSVISTRLTYKNVKSMVGSKGLKPLGRVWGGTPKELCVLMPARNADGGDLIYAVRRSRENFFFAYWRTPIAKKAKRMFYSSEFALLQNIACRHTGHLQHGHTYKLQTRVLWKQIW